MFADADRSHAKDLGQPADRRSEERDACVAVAVAAVCRDGSVPLRRLPVGCGPIEIRSAQGEGWMGHHSPAFTLSVYVHLLPDDLPKSRSSTRNAWRAKKRSVRTSYRCSVGGRALSNALRAGRGFARRAAAARPTTASAATRTARASWKSAHSHPVPPLRAQQGTDAGDAPIPSRRLSARGPTHPIFFRSRRLGAERHVGGQICGRLAER
jgi:hypothetical protein